MTTVHGYRRIAWMQAWAPDFVDPGHFIVDEDTGHFVFGAITVEVDARVAENGHHVDFSWTGMDESDEASGRGRLSFTAVNIAEGHLFIYLGDDSIICIQRQS